MFGIHSWDGLESTYREIQEPNKLFELILQLWRHHLTMVKRMVPIAFVNITHQNIENSFYGLHYALNDGFKRSD